MVRTQLPILAASLSEYNFPMKFRLLALLLLAPIAFAQGAPDMASAPHYKQLLANDQVRVFALTLSPLEWTLARHDRNFLTLALQDCDVVMWPEGESDILSFRYNQGDVGSISGDARLASATTGPAYIATSPSNFSIPR